MYFEVYRRVMLQRVRLVGVLLIAIGLGELILAVEFVDQGSLVDDRYRRFLAGWLETQLWIDLRLLAASGMTLIAATVLLLVSRGEETPSERASERATW